MGEKGFNEVLDLMDLYDNKLTAMVQCYDDAMTSLSYLKFNNPYCPITTRGFKVTPALKKVNDCLQLIDQKQIKFNDRAEQDTEQYEQQERIEKQLEQEMKKEKRIDIIDRFGIVSQRPEIEIAKNKFDKLVQIIIDLAKTSLAIKQLNK